MKRLLIFALLFTALNLSAIICLPGSGLATEFADRDFVFKYHESRDDLHFYGATEWAVCFDFANYFHPNNIGLSFTAKKLHLWFPQSGGDLEVRLMSDVGGMPGLPEIGFFETTVTGNTARITLPEPLTSQKLWMLVTYDTNFATRFVAASNVGGSHSYYLNTSMGTAYYQSFADAGFAAELLFGVEGDFEDFNAFRLSEFSYDGANLPGSRIYPKFTILNHRDQPLTDARISLSLEAPDASANVNRVINIPQAIAAHGSFTWDSSTAGYWEQGIQLPAEPSQLRLRGALSAGSTNANTIDRYIYTFNQASPAFLVENFLSQTTAQNMIQLEQQVLTTPEFRDIQVLNYFPALGDSLSSPGARVRFNWYGYNSLPRVTFGGKRGIWGFDGSFASQFTAKCDSLARDKGFVTNSSATATFAVDGISLRFVLVNEHTRFLQGGSYENLITNCRFSSGIFEKINLGGRWIWNLVRWIGHATPVTSPLDIGQTLTIETETARTGLDPQTQYRVFYWLQQRKGGPIFYANYLDLNIPVSAEDQLAPAPSLHVSPNPLKGRQELLIDLGKDGFKRGSELLLYNLRGQLIHSQSLTGCQTRVSADLFPASGIYLLRIKSPGSPAIHTKISIIK